MIDSIRSVEDEQSGPTCMTIPWETDLDSAKVTQVHKQQKTRWNMDSMSMLSLFCLP